MPAQLPQPVDRVLRLFRVDFAPAHRQPPAVSVVAATIASVAGSLGADALLVVIGQAVSRGADAAAGDPGRDDAHEQL
ncbi:MAG: hypothetical protein JWM19_3770 [Actinomycetia bacterium]|nr:hypothetical protein [Actinomycetes bacterium]